VRLYRVDYFSYGLDEILQGFFIQSLSARAHRPRHLGTWRANLVLETRNDRLARARRRAPHASLRDWAKVFPSQDFPGAEGAILYRLDPALRDRVFPPAR
jgi:hypothetical protein